MPSRQTEESNTTRKSRTEPQPGEKWYKFVRDKRGDVGLYSVIFVSKTAKGGWFRWRDESTNEEWNEQGLNWHSSVRKALRSFVQAMIQNTAEIPMLRVMGVRSALSVKEAASAIHLAYDIAGEEAFN